MIRSIFKTTVVIALLATTGTALSQQAITIVGGDITGDAGSVSFSGGEVAVQRSVARAITVVNITEYFTEGVQQAYAGTVSGIDAPLPFAVSVAPNPTTERVEVRLDAQSTPSGLGYTLLNLQGKQLMTGTIDGDGISIDLTGQPSGVYLLRLDAGGSNVYKIIKH